MEGEVKLNYYHRYAAFILAGEKFTFMLDIEPIYTGEGELSSSQRLLGWVCRAYPKAFEVVVGDGLYLNGTIFNLLASHNKHTAAVLKDERRALFEEAMSLSEISQPVVCEDKKVSYRVWDHTVSGQWDGYKSPVRVIRSEEIKKLRRHLKDLGRWEYLEERQTGYG